MLENVSEAEGRPSLLGGGAAYDGSRAWVTALQGPPNIRDEALVELHKLLLRAARFELSRSGQGLSDLPRKELDAIANSTADDALIAVLARLEGFRGASRFTTWAAKFALHDARHRLRAARAGTTSGAGTTHR
jgi:RNA polymerase sigma-70 factor (ECF subfamily)